MCSHVGEIVLHSAVSCVCPVTLYCIDSTGILCFSWLLFRSLMQLLCNVCVRTELYINVYSSSVDPENC